MCMMSVNVKVTCWNGKNRHLHQTKHRHHHHHHRWTLNNNPILMSSCFFFLFQYIKVEMKYMVEKTFHMYTYHITQKKNSDSYNPENDSKKLKPIFIIIIFAGTDVFHLVWKNFRFSVTFFIGIWYLEFNIFNLIFVVQKF